jgi:Uncharacterized protein conserved in bacteria (DUF2264)
MRPRDAATAEAVFTALCDAGARLLSEVLSLAGSPEQAFLEATPHLGAHGSGAARAELLARGGILARAPWRDGARRVLSLADALTDPDDPRFVGWPWPGQNPTLEVADLAITLLHAPADQVPELHHLPRWLEEAADVGHRYENNWQLAPIFAQVALRRLGRQVDRALLSARLGRLGQRHVDGIYLDSPDAFDLYPFWAWHYYLHHLSIHLGDEAPPLPDADITLAVLDCLVSREGAILPVGRSIAYQEAALFPCIAIARTHPAPHTRAEARRLYWVFWRSRLHTDWGSADWREIFAARAPRHCADWFYGTTHSCLWALRGVDPGLLAALAAGSGAEPTRSRGRIAVLPSVGVFTRSPVASACALRLRPERFTRVRPAAVYDASVVAASLDHSLRLSVVEPVLSCRRESATLVSLEDATGRTTGVLVPTGRSVWLALHPSTRPIRVRIEGARLSVAAGLDAGLRLDADGLLSVPPDTGLLLCVRLDGAPCVLGAVESSPAAAPRECPLPVIRSLQDAQGYFDRLYACHGDPWAHANVRRWLGNFALSDLILRDAELRDAAYFDLGCGLGDTVALLRDRGVAARGGDVAPQAVKAAAARWQGHARAFAEIHDPGDLQGLDPGTVLLLKDVDYYLSASDVERLLSVVRKARLRVLVVRTGRSIAASSPAEAMLRARLRRRRRLPAGPGRQLCITEYAA